MATPELIRTVDRPDPGAPQLLRAADRGAGYLMDNLEPGGKFCYQRNAQTGRPVPGQYNLLRHFGSLWALLELRGDDPAVRDRVDRALRWAVERYYVRGRAGGAFRKRDWIATGCSGLALLALNRNPGRAWTELRAALADFLLAQQILDPADEFHLDFHHKIPLADPAASTPFRSAYYTGEILFGLVTELVAVRRSGDGLPRAARIETAVSAAMGALQARDYGVAERSHWMMYAIRHYCAAEQLYRPDLLAWAGRIAASVLASGRRSTRSAPTACRVEAQVQFLDLLDECPPALRRLPEVQRMRAPVLAQVHSDCALLLRLQDRSGGLVGSATDPIMQIDYTQHAISALHGAAPRFA